MRIVNRYILKKTENEDSYSQYDRGSILLKVVKRKRK